MGQSDSQKLRDEIDILQERMSSVESKLSILLTAFEARVKQRAEDIKASATPKAEAKKKSK